MGPRDDEHNATPPDDSRGVGARDAYPEEDVPPSEGVEQYVQLHEHIEQLRRDCRPTPPAVGMPDEARTYQMAALFRAAAPDAAEPDPAFVRSLASHIDAERMRGAERRTWTSKRRAVSRRSVLGVGAAAAAALVGVAGGALIERHTETGSQAASPGTGALVPEGAGVWVSIAQADTIPLGGVLRFNTEFIVGFIRHTSAGFSALSGTCTHMGCLLMWNTADRTFDCPCHGGRFAENGASAPTSPVRYSPLPTIQTRVESGQVWVYVVPPADGTPDLTPSRYANGSGA